MARYDTILFDADNTLLDFLRSEREALCDSLQGMGVCPNEAMLQAYSKINDATWKRLEKGEITKLELREVRFFEFCKYFGLALDVPKLANAYLDALATKSFLMEGALAVCTALAKACRLYIITNGIAAVQHGRFDTSPLRPLFRDVFISDELGHEKPHRAFFDCVAARIPHFEPASTLVIGDSLSSDISGGIGAGLDTCWLNPKRAAVPTGMPITYIVEKLEDVVPLVLGQ